jgi:caa(3)-type oxidase subunit IV
MASNTSDSNSITGTPSTSNHGGQSARLTYTIVFIILALITAVEILLSTPVLSLTRGMRNTFFVLFSLGKASLVAAFYMHLRSDSRLYTYVFLAPVVMLIIFAYVMVIS